MNSPRGAFPKRVTLYIASVKAELSWALKSNAKQ